LSIPGELIPVIIGGAISLVSALLVTLTSHWMRLRVERHKMRLDMERLHQEQNLRFEMDTRRRREHDKRAFIQQARAYTQSDQKASFNGLDLTGAELSGVDLRGVQMRGANLSGALLRHTCLAHSDLEGAVCKGADLEGADLQQANLRSVDFTDAVLRGASLLGADTRGASFIRADLSGCQADSDVLVKRAATPPKATCD
jgi:uncharacterized protein YjbI with pentapeptide repeats